MILLNLCGSGSRPNCFQRICRRFCSFFHRILNNLFYFIWIKTTNIYTLKCLTVPAKIPPLIRWVVCSLTTFLVSIASRLHSFYRESVTEAVTVDYLESSIQAGTCFRKFPINITNKSSGMLAQLPLCHLGAMINSESIPSNLPRHKSARM